MTHRNSHEKSVALLQRIADKVGEGTVRISHNGTPHLLIKGASVVRFASTKNFRVFYPYPAAQQTKTTLPHWGAVADFLQEVA